MHILDQLLEASLHAANPDLTPDERKLANARVAALRNAAQRLLDGTAVHTQIVRATADYGEVLATAKIRDVRREHLVLVKRSDIPNGYVVWPFYWHANEDHGLLGSGEYFQDRPDSKHEAWNYFCDRSTELRNRVPNHA